MRVSLLQIQSLTIFFPAYMYIPKTFVYLKKIVCLYLVDFFLRRNLSYEILGNPHNVLH